MGNIRRFNFHFYTLAGTWNMGEDSCLKQKRREDLNKKRAETFLEISRPNKHF